MEIDYKGQKILISKEDEDLLKYKWYIDSSIKYVRGTINKKKWLLHRYIFIVKLGQSNLTPRDFIDHINGNKLDNRRENLRIATASQNAQNIKKKDNASSVFFGVKKDKRGFDCCQF